MVNTEKDGKLITQKQHIQYVLEYGIGVKVDNKEQFRQIYRGKAHKCIITDLMPRTTFRLRVAPILHVEMIMKPNQNVDEDEVENGEKMEKKTVTHTEQGEWAEVTNITTKETQTFDVAYTSKSPAPNLLCAQMN